MILSSRLVLFLLSSSIQGAISGSVPEGGTCNLSNDRTDDSTHKFSSDCDDRTFCSPNTSSGNSFLFSPIRNVTPPDIASNSSGICTKRLCRRDEYPFGYTPNEDIPPLCERNYYCPDRGNGCSQLLPVGYPCDMDRNYQCAAPKNWNSSTSSLNFNGSVCLKSVCM